MILKENGNKKSKNEHVKECLFVNFSLFLPRSSKIYGLIIIVIIIIHHHPTQVLQDVWALGLGDGPGPGVSWCQLLIGDGVMLHCVSSNLKQSESIIIKITFPQSIWSHLVSSKMCPILPDFVPFILIILKPCLKIDETNKLDRSF